MDGSETKAAAAKAVARDPKRWLILVVLCLSTLVLVVDNMVLTVSVPPIAEDLDASASDLQWILDSYMLVFAGLLLTMGALGDRFGRKLALNIGLLVFVAVSRFGIARLQTAEPIEGIGLMRSEFLFLERDTPPSEDEQYEVYKTLVEAAGDYGAIVRLFDVGGEFGPDLKERERNPALGLRAVRHASHSTTAAHSGLAGSMWP